MAVFTLLSRAAVAAGTAKVTVSVPQNQMITQEVTGSGKIQGTREAAVFVPEGQKIAQVEVQAGQTVQQGQVLLTLLESSLKENIELKEYEIREVSRKLEDAENQKKLQEQKKQYETARAEEDLDAAVSNGDINISNARNELEIAIARLEQFQAEKKAEEAIGSPSSGEPDFTDGTGEGESGQDGEASDAAQEQALADEVRAKQEALNQVIMSRNQEVKAADRARQDAALPSLQDSTGESLQDQLSRLLEDKEELERILLNQGEIRAPFPAVVKTIAAKTGGETTGEACGVLYELTGELLMTGTVTEEAVEFLSVGAPVKLEGTGKKTEENAELLSVQEDSTAPGSFLITVRVPEGSFAIGETVKFQVENSSGPYSCTVPVSALYGSEGQEYVFVMDSVKTVLGEEMVARKVSVSVQEKNHTFAALRDGSLASGQKVITNCDREIEDGSRIRLLET